MPTGNPLDGVVTAPALAEVSARWATDIYALAQGFDQLAPTIRRAAFGSLIRQGWAEVDAEAHSKGLADAVRRAAESALRAAQDVGHINVEIEAITESTAAGKVRTG